MSIFAVKSNDLLVLKSIPEIKSRIGELRLGKNTLGLVPTMGALHEGHLSLIRRSIKENEVTVVSIFVNPTQFNEESDFRRYPRNLEGDLGMLGKLACDMVFAPSAGEMYPEQDRRTFDFGDLDKTMEGRFRPGHFNGVAQIVTRLLSVVGPDKAYFGEKDFQQLVIVRYLVRSLDMPVEIIACPVVRESDGLAMSSRNRLLSRSERKAAALIPMTLMRAVEMPPLHTVSEIREFVIRTINAEPLLEVEYFEIVDEEHLNAKRDGDGPGRSRACIAVRCGAVRLIDNMNISF